MAMMRLLLAGLFVTGGVMLPVLLVGESGLKSIPPLLLGLGTGGFFLLLCFAAFHFFNPASLRLMDRPDLKQHIKELEEKGLLSITEYKATRAFGVEEFEDEGPHYFIELEDGSVLYLNGQYLYDYEPIDDEPEMNQTRRFPCTEFTLRQHRTEGYVIDILCRGEVLEPEIVAPPFTQDEYRRGTAPEDGQILRDRDYETIKQERLKSR